MRIITGRYKGRRLEMPVGRDIRPTSEKVKEAIFSTIQTQIPEAVCVDLFTGTGNLGLEALSRGAEKCYFCDNSRESLRIAERNIDMCGARGLAEVIAAGYEKALSILAGYGVKAALFFLDPPYGKGFYEDCFRLIGEFGLLSEDGLILAEHDSRDVFPDVFSGFVKIKDKTFGHVAFTIYAAPEDPGAESGAGHIEVEDRL